MAETSTATPLPLRALQRLLSKAIELDAATAARLRALEGRTVSLRLEPPGLELRATVLDGAILLAMPGDDSAADLALRLPPAAILAQLAQAAIGETPAAKGVQVAGDAELARALFEIARNYQPDGAELLTPWFGDVLGQQIAEGLQGAARFARRSLSHLGRNTSEYLREESRDLIAPAEMSELIDQIDVLRDDLARVESRIQRLSANSGGSR